MRTTATLFAAACLLVTPVAGQDDPPAGMAVAQAAEAGIGVCFSTDAGEAMDCAQQECMAQSGLGREDCAVNLWCYPHWWSAQVAVLHNEGIGWSKFFCDELSREKLEAAIKLYCSEETFAECHAVRIWDRDGKAVLDFDD